MVSRSPARDTCWPTERCLSPVVTDSIPRSRTLGSGSKTSLRASLNTRRISGVRGTSCERSCSTSFNFSLKNRSEPSFSPRGTIASFRSRSVASLTLSAVEAEAILGCIRAATFSTDTGRLPRIWRTATVLPMPWQSSSSGNRMRTFSTAWWIDWKARRMSLSKASYSVTVVASHPTSVPPRASASRLLRRDVLDNLNCRPEANAARRFGQGAEKVQQDVEVRRQEWIEVRERLAVEAGVVEFCVRQLGMLA